jgi:hypothetical protein
MLARNVLGSAADEASMTPHRRLFSRLTLSLSTLAWATAAAAVGIDDIDVRGGPAWVDVATGALADAAGVGAGVAWGDFDTDGDLDLFVVNNMNADKFLRNDAGTWVDATSGALVDFGYGYGVSAADYDNDGDLDLYINGASPGRLARNDGGTWADATNGALLGEGGGRGIVWGDFDRDGDADLFLSNDADSSKLMRNDAGTWVDDTQGRFGGVDNWQGAAAVDFDRDLDLDLFVVNGSGTFGAGSKLYSNNGGYFTETPAGALRNVDNPRGVAWADYDNDGDFDAFVTSFGLANRLVRNDGGVYVNATSGPLADAGNEGVGVAWADYDNDGDLDLYVANQTGPNKLFRNDAGTWVDATVAPLGDTSQSRGCAWGDVDQDGDLDLYVANQNGPNRLFRNDQSTGNHWLHVDLEGTISNRSAIGARVRVVADGVSRLREVSGGDGYCSQNSLTVEFGLGASSLVDTIEVRWPSGIIWDSTAVAVDQVLDLIEFAIPGDVRDGRGVGASVELAAALPNPFAAETRFEYALPVAGRARLTIVDLQGRRVATLVDGEAGPGRHGATWDGRDARGRRAREGIYFARLEVGTVTLVRKVVLGR